MHSQAFSRGEKLIKRAQRGELQPYIRPGLAALHQREEIIPEIFRRAFFPGRFGFRPKGIQRFAVRFDCPWRSISLDLEITQEFLDESAFPWRALAPFIISSGVSSSSGIAVRMILCGWNNSERFLDFARNDNRKRYSGLSTV